MPFNSLSFVVLIGISLLSFYACKSKVWRRASLIGASGAFIISYSPELWTLWPIILFGTIAVIAVFISSRFPSYALVGTFLPTFGSFLWIKGYLPGELVNHSTVMIGMSYILFRTLQILSDLQEGMISSNDLNLLEVLLFFFSFLTFVAGPIQRYDEFQKQLMTSDKMNLSDIDLKDIGRRISLGLIKLVIIAPWVNIIYGQLLNVDQPSISLGFGACIFMLWIYVNFSAYMDIVIGVGKLFGLNLPENFDSPYRATDFLDIWNRWHITLSKTFLTYIFNPLVRFFMKLQSPFLAGVLAYMIVFFLIGWWHGPGSNFALSGVMLGIVAVINKVWLIARQKKLIPNYFSFAGNLLSGGLGLGACAIALLPTWPLFTSAKEVFSALDSSKLFATILLVACAIGVCVKILGWIYDQLISITLINQYGNYIFNHPVTHGLVLSYIVWVQISSPSEFSAAIYYQRF